MVFGKGVLDVPAVLKALQEVKFKGYISIEYEANPEDPSPDMKACVEVFKEAVEEAGVSDAGMTPVTASRLTTSMACQTPDARAAGAAMRAWPFRSALAWTRDRRMTPERDRGAAAASATTPRSSSCARSHSDLMMLRVRPDFPVPPHKPGQYSTLGLGYWEPRVPGCQEEMPQAGRRRQARPPGLLDQLLVLDDARRAARHRPRRTGWSSTSSWSARPDDREPPALTPRLFMLQEGDRLFLGEKITGHFTLDPVKPGDTVLFLVDRHRRGAAQLHALGTAPPRPHGPDPVACCVRYRRDLGYLAIHEELMRPLSELHLPAA